MPFSVWTSLALGVALGVANAAASLALQRRAEGRSLGDAARLVLGGMLLRMFVLLGVAGAVLALLPVHTAAFVGGLFAVFVAGTAAELLRVRRVAPTVPPAPTRA